MSETNIKTEYTITKILQSEAARYASILVFIIPIAVFIYQIKLDIELIKQNHFTHIEQINKELLEQKEEMVKLNQQQVELQERQLIILEKLTGNAFGVR